MRHNIVRRNIDDALPALAHHVMKYGTTFESRAGKTQDFDHIGVTLNDPYEREITLPHRKHNLAAQIAETMWVLSGRDDVEWLARYLPRATDFSDDGEVWRGGYGKRIRRWPRRNGDVIDQLAHVVRLLQADPNTRRAVISIYDPEVDTADGKDIPCNDFLTFSIRDGRLSVGVTIRSNDLMWGWSGINAFEWSALQEIVAGLVGVEVGQLHFSITSLHLYERHWDKAEKIALGTTALNTPDLSPRFDLINDTNRNMDTLDALFREWFRIEERIRKDISVDASVEAFPEPMFQSWLRVLQWWWTGDDRYLEPLKGTRLEASARVAVQPKKPKTSDEYVAEIKARQKDLVVVPENFTRYVTDLHSEKHAAYGDSWKRRGEMLGIMANIARKIDRLGGGETADESSADTAIDLLVYLAKYRVWLTEHDPTLLGGAPRPVDNCDAYGDPGHPNALIRHQGQALRSYHSNECLEKWLTSMFDQLEQAVTQKRPKRYEIVDEMLPAAFTLAELLWESEQLSS
jgi:thymidylate synthase